MPDRQAQQDARQDEACPPGLTDSVGRCRRPGRLGGRIARAGGFLFLSGCSGIQSALEPAGRGAEQLADLFWLMAGGTLVVWLAVLALAVYAMRSSAEEGERRTSALIVGGGVIIPTVVLTLLLIHGLRIMPELLAEVPKGTLRVVVSGEQWWWRVRYEPPGTDAVQLANEIRLPVGEPVEFLLESPDVIHSFWIPSLGGKMDMIPGRRNRLVLHPTRTGVFRGVCAEYCGTSHALMAFPVVVMERAEFDRWLEGQRRPAVTNEATAAGRSIFFANGCSACHRVAGTSAQGVVGPDLTHVGSRLTLGAGILPNDPNAFMRWVARTESVKPGVHMPAFHTLTEDELRALGAWLESLQ